MKSIMKLAFVALLAVGTAAHATDRHKGRKSSSKSSTTVCTQACDKNNCQQSSNGCNSSCSKANCANVKKS